LESEQLRRTGRKLLVSACSQPLNLDITSNSQSPQHHRLRTHIIIHHRTSKADLGNHVQRSVSPSGRVGVVKVVLASQIHPDTAHRSTISVWSIPLLSKELPSAVDRAGHETIRAESRRPEGESLRTRVGVAVHVEAIDSAVGFGGGMRTGVADGKVVGDVDTLASWDANIQAAGIRRPNEDGGVLRVRRRGVAAQVELASVGDEWFVLQKVVWCDEVWQDSAVEFEGVARLAFADRSGRCGSEQDESVGELHGGDDLGAVGLVVAIVVLVVVVACEKELLAWAGGIYVETFHSDSSHCECH